MTDPLSTDGKTQLDQIQDEVRRLNDKFDRLIIGDHSQEGVIPRVTRHEERIDSTRSGIAWLTAMFFALVVYLIAH